MQNVLHKVYGACSPATEHAASAVREAGKGMIPANEEWLFLEGDMLRISWEGLYFPLEEVIQALREALPEAATGKLDYIDLEEWQLSRFEFANGNYKSSTRSLNHVLDYSGH